MRGEPRYHCSGTLLGEFLIGRTGSYVVGVPLDAQLKIGLVIEQRFDLLQDRFGVGQDGGLAGFGNAHHR